MCKEIIVAGEDVLKECLHCKSYKPFVDFRLQHNKHEYQNVCKSCKNTYNKERIVKYTNTRKRYLIQYNLKNKEHIKHIRQAWYRQNSSYHNEYMKIWYQKNKKQIHLKNKTRMLVDINFKIKKQLQHRLWLALFDIKKCKSTLELLGCDISTFKTYMENKFKDGMTWENHGQYGWHIDHIIPCASFDLTDPENQKKCFHYTNMQPLWWKENLRKGNKLVTKTINN